MHLFCLWSTQEFSPEKEVFLGLLTTSDFLGPFVHNKNLELLYRPYKPNALDGLEYKAFIPSAKTTPLQTPPNVFE